MGRPRLGTTEEERFWSRIRKSDGCWEWIARSKTRSGYGRLEFGGVRQLAHRVSWKMHFGDIPTGLFVCHTCDNPPCVRPDHLWLGTNRDNIMDAEAKGRMRHASGASHWNWQGGPKPRPRKGRPSGDTHYSRTNPERLARGERHGSKLHPDRVLRGEQHGNAILNADIVRAMRELHGKGVSQAEIARRFSVNYQTTHAAIVGRLWRHV